MIDQNYKAKSERQSDQLILNKLRTALGTLQLSKPGDRSEEDRAYAIIITDLEKTIAYFKMYVADR